MTDPREALRAKLLDLAERAEWEGAQYGLHLDRTDSEWLREAAALLLSEAPRQTDEPGTVLDCGR